MKKPKILNLPKDKKVPKTIKSFLDTFNHIGYRFYFGYMITTYNGKIAIGEVVHALKTKAQPQYVFSVDGKIRYPKTTFFDYTEFESRVRIPSYWPIHPDQIVYRKYENAKTIIIRNYYSELNNLSRQYYDFIYEQNSKSGDKPEDKRTS